MQPINTYTIEGIDSEVTIKYCSYIKKELTPYTTDEGTFYFDADNKPYFFCPQCRKYVLYSNSTMTGTLADDVCEWCDSKNNN